MARRVAFDDQRATALKRPRRWHITQTAARKPAQFESRQYDVGRRDTEKQAVHARRQRREKGQNRHDCQAGHARQRPGKPR